MVQSDSTLASCVAELPFFLSFASFFFGSSAEEGAGIRKGVPVVACPFRRFSLNGLIQYPRRKVT